MKRISTAWAIVAIVTFLPMGTVHGDDLAGFVGAGIAATPDYEGANDYVAMPVVQTYVRWRRGYYIQQGSSKSAGRALRVQANLLPKDNDISLEFGPILQYRWHRDHVAGAAAAEMMQVGGAVELGGFVGLAVRNWHVALGVLTEVTDEHNGTLMDLRGGYRAGFGNHLKLDVGMTVTYADKDYMATYFGVAQDAAQSTGLPAFEAHSAIKDIGFDAALLYHMWRQWGVMAFAKYNRLLTEAQNSPIVHDVGDENQWTVGLTLVYLF